MLAHLKKVRERFFFLSDSFSWGSAGFCMFWRVAQQPIVQTHTTYISNLELRCIRSCMISHILSPQQGETMFFLFLGVLLFHLVEGLLMPRCKFPPSRGRLFILLLSAVPPLYHSGCITGPAPCAACSRCPFEYGPALPHSPLKFKSSFMFRTEEGHVCGVHQDRLNEVLNHFYRWTKKYFCKMRTFWDVGDFYLSPKKL